MPSFKKTVTLFSSCLAATAKAFPTSTAAEINNSTPSCPEANETARIYASELYNLFPGQPDLASPPVADFHVQYNNQTGLVIQQAAVFSKLPKEATGCYFGWAQDDAWTGILVAGGSGLLTGRQLAGFPNATGNRGVSAAAVKPFDTASPDKAFEADFTSWDREIKGTYHISGPDKISCAEEVYLIIEKPQTTNGNVFLKRTQNAGIFLEYRC
ncbi:hypothetical protein F5Y06DRAFT_281255 [Hypoxylon sp. FL0890]|nr:hypothetical protein F5Y06DRAFT_281255 [Hypoxylon sp. FL0890]